MNCIISCAIGIVTGFVNGLFGSGGGTVLVPCLERLLKIKPQRAHATAIAVILPLSLVSALLYLSNASVDVKSLIAICPGGIIGGFCGARLLGKISAKYLHLVFGACMIAGAVRMLLK
jgi:hypothetical protein